MVTFKNVFLTADDLKSVADTKPKTFLEPQHQAAYTSWREDNSDKNRAALLQSISPLIDYHVSTIGNADKNYLTIQGKILAMRAMEKYDPTKASLSTYLSGQLIPLRRYARQSMNILSVPERVMLASQQLEGAEVELEDTLGRSPTTDELADHLGMSTRQIEKIRRTNHAQNTGAYNTPSEDGSMRSPAVKRSISQKYVHDFVLSALDADPISKFIYENDNGLHGRKILTNQELAAKLRLSPGAVSQRRKRILEILNKAQDRI
jgi:RNA polymerase sigma-B factor